MSIYVSIFIILLSILRHSGNDHNVIKSDKIIFQRGWHTVPVYSIHFHLYSFSAAQKPGGIEPQLVWCVAFLYCFISLKENLVPNCSRQAVVSLGCIYTVLPQKKKKKKCLKESKKHIGIENQSDALYQTDLLWVPFFALALSFLWGLIQMILSCHYGSKPCSGHKWKCRLIL